MIFNISIFDTELPKSTNLKIFKVFVLCHGAKLKSKTSLFNNSRLQNAKLVTTLFVGNDSCHPLLATAEHV